jgi:hypothetical protein
LNERKAMVQAIDGRVSVNEAIGSRSASAVETVGVAQGVAEAIEGRRPALRAAWEKA